MKTYRISNTTSGADLGCYKGESPEVAIAAMLADAGASGDEEGGEHIVAVEARTTTCTGCGVEAEAGAPALCPECASGLYLT